MGMVRGRDGHRIDPMLLLFEHDSKILIQASLGKFFLTSGGLSCISITKGDDVFLITVSDIDPAFAPSSDGCHMEALIGPQNVVG